MFPQYSQPYEEISEDIFSSYRNQIQVEEKEKKVINYIKKDIEIDADLIAKCKELFIWANEQGQKGITVTDLEFSLPIFSDDPFNPHIEISCNYSKKRVKYIGEEIFSK